jgi:phage tail-like protein
MVAVRVHVAPGPELRLVEDQGAPEDTLARYLPGILRKDPFLSDFLRIFDSVLRPIVEAIGSMDAYFDPRLTPGDLLPWLAGWVGAGIQGREDVTRLLAAETASIHRARGTKAGMRRALAITTGSEPLVIENTEGLRLDADARLGINTTLAPFQPNALTITLIKGADEIDEEAVAGTIRELKPAHATYSLRISEA